MSNKPPIHNQPPADIEHGRFNFEEMIVYEDGEAALGYRTPGDTLDLGPGSLHKYARNFWAAHAAIIKTRSGNSYGLAGGHVLVKNSEKAYKLPDEAIKITIGEPCDIPGVARTTEVESVIIDYSGAKNEVVQTAHHESTPSPFPALKNWAASIRE